MQSLDQLNWATNRRRYVFPKPELSYSAPEHLTPISDEKFPSTMNKFNDHLSKSCDDTKAEVSELPGEDASITERECEDEMAIVESVNSDEESDLKEDSSASSLDESNDLDEDELYL